MKMKIKHAILVGFGLTLVLVGWGCATPSIIDDLENLPQIVSDTLDWPRTLESPAGEIVRDGPSERILTLSAGHDEMVFELLNYDASKLVGVGSATPFFSNIGDRVGDLTPVGKDVEQILTLNPDIVIVDQFTDAAFVSQLQAVNIPVFQTTHDLDDDFGVSNLLTLGYLLGLEDEAAALVETLRARIATVTDAAAQTPVDARPNSLVVSKFMQIWASGDGSTAGNILDALELPNVAADVPFDDGFISVESIASFNPYAILINGGADPEEFRTELLEDAALANVPAIADEQIFILNGAYAGTLSHWNVCALEQAAKFIFADALADLEVCAPFQS